VDELGIEVYVCVDDDASKAKAMQSVQSAPAAPLREAVKCARVVESQSDRFAGRDQCS
jgi:hypothetical protein